MPLFNQWSDYNWFDTIIYWNISTTQKYNISDPFHGLLSKEIITPPYFTEVTYDISYEHGLLLHSQAKSSNALNIKVKFEFRIYFRKVFLHYTIQPTYYCISVPDYAGNVSITFIPLDSGKLNFRLIQKHIPFVLKIYCLHHDIADEGLFKKVSFTQSLKMTVSAFDC